MTQALCDCYEARKTFAFIAVMLDCLNDAARAFYQQWDFAPLPGHPYRLFLSAKRLVAMMAGPAQAYHGGSPSLGGTTVPPRRIFQACGNTAPAHSRRLRHAGDVLRTLDNEPTEAVLPRRAVGSTLSWR